MAEALKKSRSAKKAALTREINKILKFADSGLKDIVAERAKSVDEKFLAFEISHEEYHITLEEEEEIDLNDTYFDEVQTTYINAKCRIQACLSQTAAPVAAPPDSSVKVKADSAASRDVKANEESTANESQPDIPNQPSSNAASEIYDLINMQSLEIEPFDGDPLKFHSFFTIFDENMDRRVFNGRTKLTKLLSKTSGKAHAAIQSCALIGGERGYEEARKILQSRFGSHHLISDRIVKGLKNGSPVKGANDLMMLSDELQNALTILNNLKRLQEVDTQSCIVDILDRIQPYLRNRWRKLAMDMKRDKDEYPSFREFVKFIRKEADDASDPVYGNQGAQRSTVSHDVKFRKSSTFVTSRNDNPLKKKYPCVLCGEVHRLFYCQTFKSMKPVERLKIVKDHKLCENCLLGNHTVENCRKSSVCSVPGCGAKHTKFIHLEPASASREVSSHQVKVAATSEVSGDSIFVPVVPVIVNGKYNTSALLDTASNTTFCSKALVDSLGIQGATVNYVLNTMSRTQENKCTAIVDLTLSSVDGTRSMKLSNVYVVENIPIDVPCVDLSRYPHLSDVFLDNRSPQVQILIGQDHSEALLPLEVKKGKCGDPFAVRTLFGWSVNGPAQSVVPVSRRVISHFITTLDDGLAKLWNLEGDSNLQNEVGWSQVDRKVVELWDREVKVIDGHYQLPIPWKPEVYVPNNVNVAVARIKSLVTSLDKSALYVKYDAEIQALLDKGYAEPVPLYDCNEDKTWYLPHHAVTNDNKPGKIRVVYDCASKFEGECLNDKCYQGPDFNNPLLHVMFRFREHHFAIMADVEAMYHQVLVPVEDRDALRFLWYDNGEIKHFRMTRHIFGGVWSASAATYALRRAVKDYGECNDIIDETVLKCFYVDDCLRSVMSKSDASKVVHGTTSLLGKGGFRLTKFISNDKDLLESVPEGDRAKEVRDFTPESNSKALGVKWNVSHDEFFFTVNVDSIVPVTRRIMLSFVSSMFDPLGFLSPVLILGRLMFQDATRIKLSWDEEMPPDLQQRWRDWLQGLDALHDLRIARCVKPSEFDDAFHELHHFSDASQQAYGTCSYLRSVNKEGKIHTALLFSKSRVSPIKPVSIPRLELQAALVAARVDSMLRREMSLDLVGSFFWVDSEIVLKYIKNDTRRFHVFVSNRIGEITRLTDPNQWFHIPGRDNPADVVSRGQHLQQLDKQLWLQGPEFLRTFKSDWQKREVDTTVTEDLEMKKEVDRSKDKFKFSCATITDTHPLDQLTEYYSSWTRLKRAVAWWLRLKRILRNKQQERGRMSLEEVKCAEVTIFKHAQSQFYVKEISNLKSNLPVDKSSSVSALCPVLNEAGLLCVGGRLEHADMPQSSKHPVILPHKHCLADKIAREFHDDAHLGVEWTLSLLRTKYWITKARVVIKRIVNQCIRCRRLNASPCIQKMANLPAERLQPNEPPFTFVGLDCFGPFVVKSGRTERKRYGCIYTCLTVRAVHLEVLDTMDTDSFLNGFRRFVARRGCPSKVWSDNGTNIVGGRTELVKALREVEKSAIHRYSVQEEIDWHFNPPQASHMGGIWERLIRTVRKVFTSLLMDTTQRLTDEVLRTLFCEVESIINSRPLTKVSSDATDLSPLTPNHLLLLQQGPDAPSGLFSSADMFRRRWRYVQHLANQFWRRWMREYIPELQKRNKWTRSSRNVQVNDLVLLCDEGTPRGLWPMGIVVEVKEGRDRLVRSVKIKTKSTVLTRPITKVVLLEEV